jgi:hypothetical protein
MKEQRTDKDQRPKTKDQMRRRAKGAPIIQLQNRFAILPRYLVFGLWSLVFSLSAQAARVVATVNGVPITDSDITARVKLMTLQGQNSTDNRRRALDGIIDDQIKLFYAENFKAIPDDAAVAAELRKMSLPGLSATEAAQARVAIKAGIAWQIVLARTVIPTITVSDEDIAKEKAELSRERGLPIETTIIRLVDIPESIKLPAPKSCDDAVRIAEERGGAPQKFSAVEYELSEDIRERIANLPLLTWSSRRDDSVLLVCNRKKTSEYGKLDELIKQNAIYKQAMFKGDQQLKQLRRKAVIVNN